MHDGLAFVVADESRIIAQQTRTERFDERDILTDNDWRLLEMKFPLCLVAAAGDVVEPPTGIDFLDGHLILRERACFVRADDGGASKRLDGGQLADDRVPLNHTPHADRQSDSNHGRQAFRDSADRQRNRRHEHVRPRLPAQDSGDENQCREREYNVE